MPSGHSTAAWAGLFFLALVRFLYYFAKAQNAELDTQYLNGKLKVFAGALPPSPDRHTAQLMYLTSHLRLPSGVLEDDRVLYAYPWGFPDLGRAHNRRGTSRSSHLASRQRARD